MHCSAIGVHHVLFISSWMPRRPTRLVTNLSCSFTNFLGVIEFMTFIKSKVASYLTASRFDTAVKIMRARRIKKNTANALTNIRSLSTKGWYTFIFSGCLFLTFLMFSEPNPKNLTNSCTK